MMLTISELERSSVGYYIDTAEAAARPKTPTTVTRR